MVATHAAPGLPGGEPCVCASTVDPIFAAVRCRGRSASCRYRPAKMCARCVCNGAHLARDYLHNEMGGPICARFRKPLCGIVFALACGMPWLGLPCLASRCLSLGRLALPCLALPCLALRHGLACLALPCKGVDIESKCDQIEKMPGLLQ